MKTHPQRVLMITLSLLLGFAVLWGASHALAQGPVSPHQGQGQKGGPRADGDPDRPLSSYTPAAVDIPLDQIPVEARLRAAQLIEDMRGTSLAPGWRQAVLGETVRPLYRPDIDTPAYYEFQVLANNEPAGFIVVSTGEHDFPIAHWNFSGEPPTRLLDRRATEQEKQPARYYRLDALDYAAEDAQGELIAPLTTLPLKVSGMDPAWLDQPVELSQVTWQPATTGADDQNPPTQGEFQRVGPERSSLQLGAWTSWSQLKQEYSQAYGVLIEALLRDAVEEWDVERRLQEEGETLVPGDVRTLALLCSTPTIHLEGAGAGHVDARMLTRSGLPPAYQITVLSAVAGQALPLDVFIDCSGQPPLVYHYTIIQEPPTLFLPMFQRQSRNGYMGTLLEPFAANWTQDQGSYWAWAGTNDQTMYRQTTFVRPPNIGTCFSGCGATAWAMLFGWADYQAESPYWTYWHPRYGLYRKDGGKGANVRAPLTMTKGIENITWEIKDDIATWCAFGSAPTFPWDMHQAARYFQGRTGTHLRTHYDVFGIPERRLREYARDSIFYRKTPAIIGTGWLKHYPLAYGYYFRSYRFLFWKRYHRYFWVNQGWGGAGNGWVPARTWFAGEIWP